MCLSRALLLGWIDALLPEEARASSRSSARVFQAHVGIGAERPASSRCFFGLPASSRPSMRNLNRHKHPARRLHQQEQALSRRSACRASLGASHCGLRCLVSAIWGPRLFDGFQVAPKVAPRITRMQASNGEHWRLGQCHNWQKTAVFSSFGGVWRTGQWCPGTESNRRHADFQSAALPTELPGHRAEPAPWGRPAIGSAPMAKRGAGWQGGNFWWRFRPS